MRCGVSACKSCRRAVRVRERAPPIRSNAVARERHVLVSAAIVHSGSTALDRGRGVAFRSRLVEAPGGPRAVVMPSMPSAGVGGATCVAASSVAGLGAGSARAAAHRRGTEAAAALPRGAGAGHWDSRSCTAACSRSTTRRGADDGRRPTTRTRSSEHNQDTTTRGPRVARCATRRCRPTGRWCDDTPTGDRARRLLACDHDARRVHARFEMRRGRSAAIVSASRRRAGRSVRRARALRDTRPV